jgi:hypothetical protein
LESQREEFRDTTTFGEMNVQSADVRRTSNRKRLIIDQVVAIFD